MCYYFYMKHPVFYFDQGCNLCSYWARKWKKSAGEDVEFLPFEHPEDEVASLFVSSEGKKYHAAQAVFELFASGGNKKYKWMYKHLPLFGWVSEWVYKQVGSCKYCATKIMNWFLKEKIKY